MNTTREIISYTGRGVHPMLNTSSTDNSKNALAVMEKAGALFEVHYPPATWESAGLHHVDDYPVVQAGKNAGEPLYKWVVRTDTDEPLGLHSGGFVESGSYRYVGEMAEQLFPNSTDSCTLFGKGERMALVQNIDDPIDLGGGDVIQPSIMWISSFNGQWSTSVFSHTYRFFCANQIVGQTPIFKVKHTRNHDLLFKERTLILEQAVEEAGIIARMARVLKDQDFTDGQFKDLIKTIMPMPPANEEGEVNTRAERRVNACREASTVKWREECTEFGTVHKVPMHQKGEGVLEKDTVDVFDGNKWLAYNAIQGAEQHSINTQFKDNVIARQKALTKAVNGQTRYATRALRELTAV